MNRIALSLVIALVACCHIPAEPAKTKKTQKQALQALHDLIGSWKCTGSPLVGTREDRNKFWQEKVAWQWQFKGKDAWLRADLSKGKYYSAFEMRYLPEKDAYQLKATTKGKVAHTFEGKLDDKKLSLERTDAKTRQSQRLIFALNHSNAFVLYYEERSAENRQYSRLYRVFCRKEGVPFASGTTGPECIVSGGLGTMPVTYKGKTYYVCCSGCRDAFKDEPEKYVKEYEEAQKKKKN